NIHLLINNAGLSYPLEWIPGDKRMVSAHGYDLAFTVNSMSHFLLTEKLLPSLSCKKNARIVHLTSSFHWKVDGSDLLPTATEKGPMTYQSDPSLQGPKHVERSYANTKLSQIWHSRSIQGCNSVCACPTWAATGIAGEDGKDFLDRFAFSVENCGPGVTSAINAILRTDSELLPAFNSNGTCFVANSRVIERIPGIRMWMTSDLVTNKLGWRDTLASILALVLLVGQRFTYDEFILQETSPESLNEKKRDLFYEWSLNEVSAWL
ncbi:MAG: hypothetical protein SGILL_010769, partial [Bacillariaceae sp.]